MKLLLWLRDHPWKTLGLCCVGGLFVLIYLFCFWDIDPVPTPPELEVRTPQVAPEKNAYTVLMKHEAWFKANKAPSGDKSEPWEPVLADDAKMQEWSLKLGEIRKEMLACEQLASPSSDSYDTLLPHLGPYRSLFRLSQMEALWHLKNGRVVTALQCISEMKSILRLFQQPQYLVDSMVQIACCRFSLEAELQISSHLNSKQRSQLFSHPWPSLKERQEWWRNSIAVEAKAGAILAQDIQSGKCREFEGSKIPWHLCRMMKPQLFKQLHQDWLLRSLPLVSIPYDDKASQSVDGDMARFCADTGTRKSLSPRTSCHILRFFTSSCTSRTSGITLSNHRFSSGRVGHPQHS